MSQQRTPFGVIQQQSVCPDCHGTGKKVTHACSHCHGKGYEHRRVKLDIKIPAGIQSGQQIRIPQKGEREGRQRESVGPSDRTSCPAVFWH